MQKVPQYIQISEIENKFLFNECKKIYENMTGLKAPTDALLLARKIDENIIKSGKSIKHSMAYLSRFYYDRDQKIIQKFLLDFFGNKLLDIIEKYYGKGGEGGLPPYLEGLSDYFNKKLQKEILNLISGISGYEAFASLKEKPMLWYILYFYLTEKYRIENSIKEEKKLISHRSNIEKLTIEKPKLPNMEIKQIYSEVSKRQYEITNKIKKGVNPLLKPPLQTNEKGVYEWNPYSIFEHNIGSFYERLINSPETPKDYFNRVKEDFINLLNYQISLRRSLKVE